MKLPLLYYHIQNHICIQIYHSLTDAFPPTYHINTCFSLLFHSLIIVMIEYCFHPFIVFMQFCIYICIFPTFLILRATLHTTYDTVSQIYTKQLYTYLCFSKKFKCPPKNPITQLNIMSVLFINISIYKLSLIHI